MGFYDLHTHIKASLGENTLEEVIEMAKALGLNGIGVVSYFGEEKEIPKPEGIDVVSCIMLRPQKADELDRMAKKARNKAEILMVHGGDYDINRAAVENPLIDVLCHPELGRKDSGLDHICAKAAADNNVAVEVNFRYLLESYKRQRIFILSLMSKNIRLCMKYKAKVVAASGSVTKWGLRSGRELASIVHILGMPLGDAIDTVSAVPEDIVMKNREKLAGKRWEGVSLVE